MELVRGLPITEHCDARRLTTRERIELFLPVCLALVAGLITTLWQWIRARGNLAQARLNRYVLEMNVAQQAIADNNLVRTRRTAGPIETPRRRDRLPWLRVAASLAAVPRERSRKVPRQSDARTAPVTLDIREGEFAGITRDHTERHGNRIGCGTTDGSPCG